MEQRMTPKERAVARALGVLVKCAPTRAWLEEHDPKALQQAEKALAAYDFEDLAGEEPSELPDAYAIRTTNNELFTMRDSAQMAAWVYLRFGRDLEAAAAAWRRMLQNNCPDERFQRLADAGLGLLGRQ